MNQRYTERNSWRQGTEQMGYWMCCRCEKKNIDGCFTGLLKHLKIAAWYLSEHQKIFIWFNDVNTNHWFCKKLPCKSFWRSLKGRGGESGRLLSRSFNPCLKFNKARAAIRSYNLNIFRQVLEGTRHRIGVRRKRRKKSCNHCICFFCLSSALFYK